MNKKCKKILMLVCGAAIISVAAGGYWVYHTKHVAIETSEDNKKAVDDNEKNNKESDESEDVKESSDNTVSNNGNGNNIINGTIAAQNANDVQGMSLPYTIAGSNLEIQGFVAYSGNYIEDGSDGDIADVTTIILKNKGDVGIEYANVSINRNDIVLQFEASAIPSGATVVVQEKNKAPYQAGIYDNCTVDVAEKESFEMSEKKVKVEESGNQSLTITNLTDEMIPAVRVFYKFYMEDEDVYVGGITYNAKLTNLGAGETQTITPAHYAKGASKIVMVRTYSTAE